MNINRLSYFFVVQLLLAGAFVWASDDPYLFQENSSYDDSLYYREISFTEDPMNWYRDNQSRLPLLSPREQSIRLNRMEKDILGWSERELQSLLPSPDYADFLSTMEELNQVWTFQTEKGQVLFDEAGDPLLLSSDPDDIEMDRAAWAAAVGTLAEEILEGWSLSANSLLGSVISRIPDEYSHTVEENLKISLRDYCRLIQKESDQLVNWSSAKMNYLRTEDNYSLRHKSEDQSAAGIADSLIAGIRDELEETEDALDSGLNELQDISMADGLSLGSEDWEDLFRSEFQKGLDKWGYAEQNFLAERLSWELRTEKEFQESEESWNEAFALFTAGREEWISEITLQMEKGFAFWQAREESTMAELRSIAEELETAALDQERKFAAQVESALSLYSDSYSLLCSAEENLSYYLDKIEYYKAKIDSLEGNDLSSSIGGGASAVSSDSNNLLDSGDEVVSPEYKELLEKIDALQTELVLYQDEYNIWQSLRTSLLSQMDDARGMLFDLELTASGYDDTVAPGILERDIQEMIKRTDRLYVQWEISQAVALYALTDSSLRDTEAETSAKYEQAESKLVSSELQYNKAVQSLSILRENLALEQLDIDEIRESLAIAEAAMLDAEKSYENSRAIYLNDDPLVIEKVIEDLEQRLVLWFRGDSENPAERDTLYLDYILAGEWERRNEHSEELQSLLRDLNGTELPQESDSFEDQQDLESALESLYDLKALNPDAGLEESLVTLKKELDLLKRLEWNNQVQDRLLDVSESEDLRSILEQRVLTAESVLLLDKVAFLKDLLISLEDGVQGGESFQGEYLNTLKEHGFSVDSEQINAVSTLYSTLKKMETEGLSLQECKDQMGSDSILWLEAALSENDLLPGAEYLELLVSGSSLEVLKAEAALEAYDSISDWTASFRLLAGNGFLQADSGEEFLEKLGSFDNFETFFDWYLPLQQSDVFPEYLEQGLNAFILHQYGSELDSLSAAGDELDFRTVFLDRLRSLQFSEQSTSLKEPGFINEIFIESFKAVCEESVSIPIRSARSYLNSFYENEIVMNSHRISINKMESDLTLKRENGDLYKIQVVDRDRQIYFDQKNEYDKVLQNLKTSLSSFDSAQYSFLQGQQAVQDSYNEYMKASRSYQQAKEISDYAGGAYSFDEYNVFTIRDARQAEYEKCRGALDILEQLDSENQNTVDSEWSQLLRYGQDLLSVTNNISYAAQEIRKELGELSRQQMKTLRNLIDNSTDFIDFSFRDGLAFSYESSMMKQGMSSFESWDNSNYNQHMDSYFSRTDSSEVFTKDLLLWLGQIAEYTNSEEVLKEFSYAYYHELRQMEGMDWETINSEYTIDLFNDARHTDLLDSEGSLFHPVHIAYEGDLDRFNNGEYETVITGLIHEGEYIRVFIEGEEWLQEQTAVHLKSIKENSTLYKQYAFYKMLMFSDAFSTDSLKHAMEKDLSMLAWEYIDAKADTEQYKFRNGRGGYYKPGQDIWDKRNTLKDVSRVYTGISGRTASASNAKNSVFLLKALSGTETRINTLSPGTIDSIEQVQSLLRTICGITLSEDQKSLATEAFSSLSSFDRSSVIHLFDGFIQELSVMTVQNDMNRLQRDEELKSEQYEQKFALSEIYNSSVWNEDKYNAAASDFYNSYSMEQYGNDSIEAYLSADNPYSRESLYTLSSYGKQLIRNFHDRLTVVKEEQYGTFRDGLEELHRQKEYWENLCGGLGREGLNQWALSLEKLITDRNSWHNQISREFERKSTLWENKYISLIESKNSWVQQSSRNVLEYGAQTFAREWDLEADRLMTDLNFHLISDLFTDTGSAGDIVAAALQGRTMDKLLSSVGNLSLRTSGVLSAPTSLALLPDRQSAFFEIEESHKELTEKVYKAMAFSRASQMKELVEQVKSSIADNLEDANRSVDESVDAQMADAGYVRQGNVFSRIVLIDSSLTGGNESETQTLEGYRFFKAPDFDHQIDLSSDYLIMLSSEMIQASVDLAQERLGHYINLVFGNEEDGNIRDGLDQSFISLLEQSEADYSASAQFDDEDNSEKKGMFNFYLGYAPVMKEDSPEEVETYGYGEFGRIYKKYFIHQARLYRGLATVNTPLYTQNIWDDDADNDGESDGLLGSPSIRTLADIAMNVVGNIFMPGIGSLLLNLVDNALFALLDVGNGVADMGQASVGFLKSAASSLISYGAGALGGVMDNLGFLQNSGMFEVAGDIGIRGISSVASNYGTAALYALDSNSNGWNWDTFNSMTSWDNAGIGYLSGMTGTAVSGTLNLGTFGFIGEMGENADRFTSLMGGLSASGLEYAMTGQTTLNLMNLGKSGTGFLEMNLGGGGSLFNFGTQGTDVSLGSLSSAAQGLALYSENQNINAAVDDRDLRAGMRTLFSSGIEDTESLYQDILDGSVTLTLSEGLGYQGYTSVDESGKRVIDLNGSGQSRLDLAVLLSHEAFRDGLNNGEAAQILETVEAASAHMAVSSALQQRYGSDSLSIDNNREAFAYRLFAQGAITKDEMTGYILNSYDSTGDFWKRLDDGRILSDGKAGLYDEIGNLIRVATDDAGNQLDEMESLQYYIDSDTAEYLSFLTPQQLSKLTYYRSSEDVNRQVNMRDEIINDYEILRNLNTKGILSGSDYQRAMDSVFQSMSMYNNEFVLRGVAVTPEGVITERFGDEEDRMKTQKDGETQYLTYTHPGIDTIGGLGIYSPGFIIPGKDVKNYAFGMNIIGMENNYLVEHMNPDDIDNLLLQELTYPGQKLMDFPELMFPTDGGGTDAHAHIELSSYNPETQSWGFSDPVGDWSDWSSGSNYGGKYEWLDIDESGEKSWTLNYMWNNWSPWQ
ncbi:MULTISPECIES: hypothetical protein [unclassified Oceanispirochaeta]|uniref:hypothetical protein n=1 Tax=unclassified Oceanispirochaeta TaxID=2635722 RepID=UPI000E090302|nr:MULTISPECIES: hypothetical protein [unclassified Oceanispirochaeta]MBF9014485.1 hypothetical protein [Oceanispirochaeta sp. M2]NPD70741.1 hypothetical protein [Oceanispirochaeta sp. M1]RDG34022.1 hypothetical protein DV872_01395 [Oceanispirochaeta sp. M1]